MQSRCILHRNVGLNYINHSTLDGIQNQFSLTVPDVAGEVRLTTCITQNTLRQPKLKGNMHLSNLHKS